VFPVFKASDALVLLGHGTVLNQDSCTTVLRHAESLRMMGLFGQVEAAFWKQEPGIQNVLNLISASRVFIVPMFISDGYFSGHVIPEALGFSRKTSLSNSLENHCRVLCQSGRTLYYTEPVGTHSEMTKVLLQSAEEAVRKFPVPHMPPRSEITLLIAGHGTPRNPDSRKSVERQADLISRMDIYAAVHPVFMEEEPLIANWRQCTHTPYAVVAPCFIGEGLHVTEDIPVLLGEPEHLVRERLAKHLPSWPNPLEKQGVLIWYAASAGANKLLAEVILARVAQAAATAG